MTIVIFLIKGEHLTQSQVACKREQFVSKVLAFLKYLAPSISQSTHSRECSLKWVINSLGFPPIVALNA